MWYNELTKQGGMSMDEKLQAFSKQFESVPKEKVIKLLYQTLEEDDRKSDIIDDAKGCIDCMIESDDYVSKKDLKYISDMLGRANIWFKEETIDNELQTVVE